MGTGFVILKGSYSAIWNWASQCSCLATSSNLLENLANPKSEINQWHLHKFWVTLSDVIADCSFKWQRNTPVMFYWRSEIPLYVKGKQIDSWLYPEARLKIYQQTHLSCVYKIYTTSLFELLECLLNLYRNVTYAGRHIDTSCLGALQIRNGKDKYRGGFSMSKFMQHVRELLCLPPALHYPSALPTLSSVRLWLL